MHVSLLEFNGNSNIGLYGFVNDNFLLLGSEIPEKYDEVLKNVFKVPIHRVTIAGTSLIGVFVTGNNEKILVPGIAFSHELKHLQEIGVPFEVVDTKITCLGNNMLITKDNVIINPDYSESQAKKIETILGIPVERKKIASLGTVGNLAVINHNTQKGIVSNEISSDEDLKNLEKALNVVLVPSSVNMGSQFLGSGILCNKNGFVIGKSSGSPEILNAETNLGFLENDQ